MTLKVSLLIRPVSCDYLPSSDIVYLGENQIHNKEGKNNEKSKQKIFISFTNLSNRIYTMDQAYYYY